MKDMSKADAEIKKLKKRIFQLEKIESQKEASCQQLQATEEIILINNPGKE